jgi:hypothetical protein
MPKKKSVKKAAQNFQQRADLILAFLKHQEAMPDKSDIGHMYAYAVIWLYMEFEHLMLQALVGAINNNTATISARTGIRFPKHLTDKVCEYLIAGDGYFDFKGRAGLIDRVKEFVPDGHYLLMAISDQRYRNALDQVSVLRNYAAHGSSIAKERAKKVLNSQKLSPSGAWLRRQNRFNNIATRLVELAKQIEARAPY